MARLSPLLVATTNLGKLAEIRLLLTGVPVELRSLADQSPLAPPQETEETFAANARDKARYYARQTGLITVAEDSGLEIAALGGAPGVRSSRYGGPNSTDLEKFALIFEALRETGSPDRSARFVCALALAAGDDILFEASGIVEGTIITEPRGHDGFGYDPIFFYRPFGCTLAEAGTRKAAVSHRSAAFGQLREYLSKEIAGIRD
jgi:XTP/dITP diphosphohydrolase